MISLIAMVLTTTSLALAPTDDVWVYPHSSDPGGDPFFRIWGAEGNSVASSAADAGQFSYGYLRFDLSSLPKDRKLVSAKLTVTQFENPSYTPEVSKQSPLEVRLLNGDFNEKSWKYEQSAKVSPAVEKDSFLGRGTLSADSLTITIDLLKGKVSLTDALKGSTLDLALVSSLDPSQGDRAMYKISTRDAKDEKVRPQLVLEFADSAAHSTKPIN
jgi:hypothetical protein